MSYNSSRILVLPIEPEETYQYGFNNIVTEGYNREERRIGRRLHFRSKMTFGDIVFKCGEELPFIQFYKDSRGSLDSFQFRSSIDYSISENPEIRSVEGETFFTYTQSFVRYTGTANNWEVYKKYAIGSGDPLAPTDVAVTLKRIYELSTTGLIIQVNGLPYSGSVTWDSIASQLVLSGIADPGAAVLKITGNYNHRVRFGDETSDFKMTLQKVSQDKAYRLSNLSLVEVSLNTPPSIIPYTNFGASIRLLPIALPPIIEANFALPLEPDNSRTFSLPALTASLDSGKESLFGSANDVFIDESIVPSNLYKDEAQLIRNFFVSCKGRLTAFSYSNDEVSRFMRFNQDLLALTKKSYEDEILGCKSVYDVSEIDLVPTFDILPPIPILTGACCVDYVCSITTEEDCAGVWAGADTVCSILTCPPPYLPLPYTTCGYTRQTIRVDPQNPNDAAILASNPTYGYRPGSNPTVRPFDIVVQALKTDASMIPLPPGATAGNNWRISQSFWENNTLWLIISATISSGSFILWQNRSALYKLNPDGCGFSYVDSNLKDYGTLFATIADDSLTKIRKTPTGTSMFVLANQGALFNTGVNASAVANGMLRFEIKPDGSQLIDFLPNSIIPKPTASIPAFTRPGHISNSNEMVLFATNISNNNYLLGTFNGIKYYVFPSASATSGIPVGANFPPGTLNKAVVESNYPNNFWIETISTTNKRAMVNNSSGVPSQLVDNYYGSTVTLQETTSFQNSEGATLIRVFTSECPTGQTSCTAGAQTSHYSLFLRSSLDSLPVLISKVVSGTGADSTVEASASVPSGTTSKVGVDKFGNLIDDGSQNINFLRGGTTNSVNFESIITTDPIRTMNVNTPYGMVAMTHSFNLHNGVTTYPTINFISFENVD